MLLAAILYSFVLSMDLQSIEWFLKSPYNAVADIKMLYYFLDPGTLTLGVIAVMALGSIFLPGFWCRGFCPYGALLGLLSLLSPMAVSRDPAACSGCGRCAESCPSRIPVGKRKRLSGPECVGCTECISACPRRCPLLLFLSAHYLPGRSGRYGYPRPGIRDYDGNDRRSGG